MSPSIRLVATSLALGCAAAACGDDIEIPAVEISAFHHLFETEDGETVVEDAVTFPNGPGEFSGPSFTATIGPGDTIIARFEAPPGKKFVVRWHSTTPDQSFFAIATWFTGVGDIGNFYTTGAASFEGFSGIMPTRTSTEDLLSDQGEFILIQERWRLRGDFEFSALVVEFTPTHSFARAERTYDLYFFVPPSFGTSVTIEGEAADEVLMSVESTCNGDVDENGTVDVADIIAVLGAWGPYGDCPPYAPEDVSKDCDVELTDVLLLFAYWGQCE